MLPASIVLQDLPIRKRFLVHLELGHQPRIFSRLLNVAPAQLEVFVIQDLLLLCVALLVRFAIFQALQDRQYASNVQVASIVASAPSIPLHVLLDFIRTLAVRTVSFAHLVFSVPMPQLPGK